MACLWGLSGSLFAAGFLVTVPVLVLAFINFYKLKIKTIKTNQYAGCAGLFMKFYD